MTTETPRGFEQVLESGHAHAKIPSGHTIAAPFSKHERNVILSQLQRILASTPFRASKRYPAFLKYVVEQTLDGKADSLKERTLGIEVFERGLEYDTNADPIVRIMASEVRKRLAQYYYELQKPPEVRIEMPSGSYIPEFHTVGTDQTEADSVLSAASAEASQITHTPEFPATYPVVLSPEKEAIDIQPEPSRRRRTWRWATIPIVLVILVLTTYELWPRPDALSRFWKPLLAPGKSVLLCIGQLRVGQAELDPNPSRSRFDAVFQLQTNGWPQKFGITVVNDVATVANIAGLIKVDKGEFVIKDKDSTTFGDLQKGPFVLVGAFNNDWTIRLTDSMRFRFNMDPARQQWWIEDNQKPGERIGVHRTDLPESASTQDYAIVARVFDPGTRQPVVILAGVDGYGTAAAGDFVTKPIYLSEFAKQAPPGWDRKNMEIIITTSVVDGDAGPPHVVASYFW